MESKPLIIIGAGGHAAVVYEAARLANIMVAGFIADVNDSGLSHVPLLGDDAALEDRVLYESYQFIVAIGDNKKRSGYLSSLKQKNATIATIIHPHSVVSPSATIAAGTYVGALAVINACATIGEGVIINTGAIVEHHCRVEPGAHIAPQAALAGNVIVGKNALVGIGAVMTPGSTTPENSLVKAGGVVKALV